MSCENAQMMIKIRSKLSISDVIFYILAFCLRERDHILVPEVFLDFSLLIIFSPHETESREAKRTKLKKNLWDHCTVISEHMISDSGILFFWK